MDGAQGALKSLWFCDSDVIRVQTTLCAGFASRPSLYIFIITRQQMACVMKLSALQLSLAISFRLRMDETCEHQTARAQA